MTNMTDKIRILLKAYGEELTLDQITKLFSNRNTNNKEEIQNAISELVSVKLIKKTTDNTYKTACTERPNFFYVFQSKSFNKEVQNNCLFCPHSPDNRTIRFWESIGDVKTGDIIFHETNQHVAAISEAQSEARDADKPYDLDKPEHGRLLHTLYAHFANSVQPVELKEQLLPAQPEKVAPFNRNGTGNEEYLFYFNQECAKIIIDGIINNVR